MTSRSLCRMALLALAAIAIDGSKLLRSQAPPPSAPSAPHEALTFFEGSWTIEERTAAQEYVETCAFLPAGRRHMVCRATYRAANGPREAWSIFSYSAPDSTYLYHGFRASGIVEPMRGRRTPDGFEFLNETGQGDARERTRVTITRLAPARFRLVASTSKGDGPWEIADTEHYVQAARKP